MKNKAKTVGRSFSADRAVKLYKAGKSVADIAVTFGYARGTGQNRVRAALIKAGAYEQTRPVSIETGRKKAAGKVMTLPVPTGPELALRECVSVIQSRYAKLKGRARSGFMERLSGALLAAAGMTTPKRIQPVVLPQLQAKGSAA